MTYSILLTLKPNPLLLPVVTEVDIFPYLISLLRANTYILKTYIDSHPAKICHIFFHPALGRLLTLILINYLEKENNFGLARSANQP